MLYLIGPMFPTVFGGVSIKNRILVDALVKEGFRVKIIDTAAGKYTIVVNLISLIFSSNSLIILSVSENGRIILLPYAYFLSVLSGKRIILLCGGGKMAQQMCALPPLFRSLYRVFCASLVQIFPETNGIAESLRLTLGLGNISVQGNFKPRPSAVPSFDQTGPVRIVYLGRVVRSKGVFVLMEAVEQLHAYGFDAELDLYGPFEPGHEGERQEAEATRCEVEARTERSAYLHYRGVVAVDRVVEIIRGYSMFVFPTLHTEEGFPGVLIDAAFAGLPVIATRSSYNSEIVVDGETGLLCEPNDVESLAKALRELARDPELRARMGRRNWELSEKYDVKVAVHRLAGYL